MEDFARDIRMNGRGRVRGFPPGAYRRRRFHYERADWQNTGTTALHHMGDTCLTKQGRAGYRMVSRIRAGLARHGIAAVAESASVSEADAVLMIARRMGLKPATVSNWAREGIPSDAKWRRFCRVMREMEIREVVRRIES